MDYEIRKSVLSDLGPALELDREAFGVDAWTILDYIGVFSIGSIQKFTALAGEKFAGFAAMEFDRKKKAACLMTLAVRPEYRKLGIGAALLQTCEDAFPGKTCYLTVDEANEGAIRLYQRAGYRQTGIEPAYYLNGHDALIFYKVKGEKQ